MAGLLLEEISNCRFWFHPIVSPAVLLRSETNVAWVRWPLQELAAGTLMIGTHVTLRQGVGCAPHRQQ